MHGGLPVGAGVGIAVAIATAEATMLAMPVALRMSTSHDGRAVSMNPDNVFRRLMTASCTTSEGVNEVK